MSSGPKRLVWSFESERDIRQIWTYYATAVSADAANKLIGSIRFSAERLEQHPYAGRSRDELRADLRSIPARPYVIFDRVNDAGPQILRVLHERRDLLAEFAKPD